MLSRIHTREEGVALITAVLTSAIIVMLGTTVVQLAIHNSEGSAYDRRRVQSVGAAEAGLDYYMSWMTKTQGIDPPCAGDAVVTDVPMQGSPGTFDVRPVSFYTTTGAPVSCEDVSADVDLGAMLLESSGTSGPASSQRTMQGYVRLTASTGTTFDNTGAVFAQNSINFTANATIGGNNFSDADIYSNGSISLASGSILYGRVFAQSTLSMASNSEVKKDVVTNGAITMSAGAKIRGSATSAQDSITLANNSRIFNGAKAAGAITGGTVDVYRSPDQAGLVGPTTRPYPTFTYNPTDWAGFTAVPFTSCSAAETYIRSTWTGGDLLVRITVPGSTCTLTFSSNTTYTVKGNLAIISDGPVTLETNARFVPTPGPTKNVFVMAGLSGTAPCDITMNTNSGFGAGLPTLLYTPQTCSVSSFSNTALTQGQILSGTVNFHHTAAYSYMRLTVPGTGVGGYKQDVVYKREIID